MLTVSPVINVFIISINNKLLGSAVHHFSFMIMDIVNNTCTFTDISELEKEQLVCSRGFLFLHNRGCRKRFRTHVSSISFLF